VNGAALLDVRDLHVRIGQSHILHGVSFSVRSGGVTGLLGRNGVGKTTTLRGILGLAARTGTIEMEGTPIGTMRTHEIVRRGIAYVPEDRDVFAELTVSGTENAR
jgi:branched-chain amino acid transport system ATP-binding protein